VNSQGLIEKERANLLLQSNQFDTTWTATNITATSGQTGYDGTTDAWLLQKSAASRFIQQSVSTSGVVTMSVYAKEGSASHLRLLAVVSGSNPFVYFNLSSGAVNTEANNIDAAIESVGGGFYRCSMTFNDSSITAVNIYPADGDGDISGTNTNIIIQDAMLNQGLVAQPYIETTTAAVYEGITNDIPRLDYPIVNGAVRDCPALLLEPQRTNLVTYSEYFSDSSWTKVNASISSNTTTSPSGATNASTLVSTSGTSEQYLDVGSLSVTSGEDYTMSVFVKKNNYDFFLIRFTGVGGAFSVGNVFFNINNGTLGTVDSGYTGSIKSFGNGWYRCSATKTASGTTASGKVRLQLATSDNTESITGDGSSGTFIYGSQFEQSSYPTSYIPTNGSSVTRNAEVCNNSGTSGDFNSTEGVLFAEIAALSDDIQQQIGVYGSSTEQLRIEITNNVIKGQLYNGAFQANMSSTQTVTNFNKVALKWKVDDFALWINGTEVATDSSGTTFSAETLDRLHFSAQNGSTYAAQAKTKQLMVFKKALTDAELETLTTL
jgi:hypothetical protein